MYDNDNDDDTALLYFVYDKTGVKCLVETIYNYLYENYPVPQIIMFIALTIIAIASPIYYWSIYTDFHNCDTDAILFILCCEHPILLVINVLFIIMIPIIFIIWNIIIYFYLNSQFVAHQKRKRYSKMFRKNQYP